MLPEHAISAFLYGGAKSQKMIKKSNQECPAYNLQLVCLCFLLVLDVEEVPRAKHTLHCYCFWLSLVPREYMWQQCATPGLFGIAAVTAEYQVCHPCQRQSALKMEKHYARALSFRLKTVLWRTCACKEQASLKMPVKKIKLLEWAIIHLFSGECLTPWKESGWASSVTHLKFCRDRPESVELHTLVLVYSCLH